jgi:hypothetical protein
MGELIGMRYPTELFANLADHTYVTCGTGGKSWSCWGGKTGGTELRRGAGSTLRIDPASYDRYNAIANAVDAIDPEGAARAYRRLRPLMQQAFDELGYVNLPFDERLARALGQLVDVPAQEGDVMLKATSVTFQYADPELEALSPAQKHMLRMGPHNMRLVQTKLRAFARAAGLTQTSGT